MAAAATMAVQRAQNQLQCLPSPTCRAVGRHLQRRRSVGRLGEPETHLRELSALDETLGFGGESVIIPNYLQIAANGMVAFSN